MESINTLEIISLAKKYDSLLIKLETYLKNVLLFKFYDPLEEVFPDYKKKYYKNAIKKGLISKEDLENIKYWINIRNELVHNKPRDISNQNYLTYYNELNKAKKRISNLINYFENLVVERPEEKDIIIFNSLENYLENSDVNKPTVFVSIPDSLNIKPSIVLNLYFIGDKGLEKTSIIKKWFYPTQNKRLLLTQSILALTSTFIYDQIRPNLYLRSKPLFVKIIKLIKALVFKSIAINYHFTPPEENNVHLIIHEKSGAELFEKDLSKGELVVFSFMFSKPLTEPSYDSFDKDFENGLKMFRKKVKLIIEKSRNLKLYYFYQSEKFQPEFKPVINHMIKNTDMRKFLKKDLSFKDYLTLYLKNVKKVKVPKKVWI